MKFLELMIFLIKLIESEYIMLIILIYKYIT